MKPFLIAGLAMMLSGCISPKLTRHYDSVDETSISKIPLELSVFVSKSPVSEDEPLIATLAERAQAQLIESVAAKLQDGSDAAALSEALAKATTEEHECAWADTTVLRKRVTLTVLGNMPRPADRIDRLQFDFVVPEEAVKDTKKPLTFSSWDKFDSTYGSFNLGSAKYTQSRNFTLGNTKTDTKNLPGAAGTIEKVLSGGYEATNALEETMNYTIHRLSVGGALTPHQARLVLEGGPYINLLGSSSAVFTIRLTPHPTALVVHKVTIGPGAKVLPDEVKITRCQAKYPLKARDVTLQASAIALKRIVVDHHDTLSEGDDTVTFEREQIDLPNGVTIATEAELNKKFFGLAYCQPDQKIHECLHLAIENPETGKIDEAFTAPAPENAAAMRRWLVTAITSNQVPGTVGFRRIGLVRSKWVPQGPAVPLKSHMVPALRVILAEHN